MNWLGWFRRSPARLSAAEPAPAPALPPPPAGPDAPPPSPDEVRRLIFDAVASGDERRIESLCQEHKDLILNHSAAWLEVPPTFRASPEAYEWYGNGLRAIARFCAERLGHTSLQDQPVPSPVAHSQAQAH